MKSESLKFEAIGTHWEIEFESARFEEICSLINAVIIDFEEKYSRFLENSLISQLANVTGEFEIDDEFHQILEVFLRFNLVTEGRFTPLVAMRLNDLGYDKDYSFESKEIREIPDLNSAIELKERKLIIKKPVEFDIGGVGKGFLIDKLVEKFKNRKIEKYIIDAGGDISYQSSIDNLQLKIGLEHPNDFSKAIGVVNLKSGESICGSSQNRRSWKNGSHIVDLDQQKYTRKILASWVVSKKATISDSAATCLFLMEPKLLKERIPEIEYLVLYNDFSVEWSEGFECEIF